MSVSRQIAQHLKRVGFPQTDYGWYWNHRRLLNGRRDWCLEQCGEGTWEDSCMAPNSDELIVCLRGIYPVLGLDISIDRNGVFVELVGLARYGHADTLPDALGLLVCQVLEGKP